MLLIDNYDSFTYNIAHIVKESSMVKLEIAKPGEIDLSLIEVFDRIIFSPGPDQPRKGNFMEMVLERYDSEKSILGICLGLQAIVLYYGGKLVHLDEVVHGRTKTVIRNSDRSTILQDIPDRFHAGFYHSWVADTDAIPECLEITCSSTEGRVMGVRHREYDIEAVQFHPESIMTPYGARMFMNWLKPGT